jgi:hypothetical protein
MNSFVVAVSADDERLHILNPPPSPRGMNQDEALVLAAWLVVLADPGGKRWAEVLAAVKNT